MPTQAEKLQAAIEYLKSRKKYVVTVGCKFRPTDPASTDVEKTVAQYRQDTGKQPVMKLVKERK